VKRKQPVAEETVVPESLLEQAKLASSERPVKMAACVVCAGECPANAAEGLCWVCRRLKLSAWRDSDSQMPAME
jgi:Zn finger protein HypA/HybF involved in hydrogenase expression